MRERTEKLLEHLHIHTMPVMTTFHSLGVLIIRENAMRAGLPKFFTIADESDAISIMKDAIVSLGLDPKQFEPRRYKNIISRQKGDFVTPEEFEKNAESFTADTILKIWRAYEAGLAAEKSLDFDDLLLRSVILLRDHADIRESYQRRFKYLHIDEYQDTNELQYAMTKFLVGPEKNICVVGDSDQNIYSWRGANIKNILHFERDFPGAKVVLLEENYRSTKAILEAANAVIEKNTMRVPKDLFTSRTGGEKITVCEAFDERAEARYVAEAAVAARDAGVPYENIAVLYRANFQSRALEEAMLDYHIPYHVLGTKFFERREVKDVLAYARLALSRESLSDYKRAIGFPSRGVGKGTLVKVFAGQRDTLPPAMKKKLADFDALLDKILLFSEQHPPSEVIKYIIIESGIERTLAQGTDEEQERLENVRELVTLAVKYDSREDGLTHLITDAALASDQDSLTDKSSGVRLMTVHAAKGLEFDTVFVVGLETDLFPHRRRASPPAGGTEEAEEERRLFYVAITRAKEKLYLTHASLRTIFGSRQINTPSEFLADIPLHLIDSDTELGSDEKGRFVFFD